MRAHVRTRTDFGRIRLIWQNLAEVDQGVKFICRVFYRDIPTVTRLVLLHIKELSIEFGFNPLYYRLYYIGHIINLVACMLLFGADLSALDKKKEDKDKVLR